MQLGTQENIALEDPAQSVRNGGAQNNLKQRTRASRPLVKKRNTHPIINGLIGFILRICKLLTASFVKKQ